MAEVDELRRRIQEEASRRQEGRSRRQPAKLEPRQQETDEGMFGVVSPESRQAVRQAISEIGPAAGRIRQQIPGGLLSGALGAVEHGGQMAVEGGPATLGSALGVAAGAPLGPAGMVGGAAVGGLAGEAIGQETGLSPRSNVGLGLSAAAPIAGPIAGAGARAARRAVGQGIQTLPAARAAMGQTSARKAADEFMSLGGRILSSQRGLMSRSADEIFDAARQSGISVPAGRFRNTLNSLRELTEELEPFNAFPEVASAVKLADRTIETIAKNQPLAFDDIIKIRTHLGDAVAKAEKAGGIRSRTANKLFSSLADDLDNLAQSASRARRPARLTKAGFERAKLELSVRDFEHGVSQFIREVPGEQSATLNVKGFRNWLRKATDPKSKQYNKNLTAAFKGELPKIKERLARLDKMTEQMNPSGPGSIVVRGVTAAGGAGAGLAIAGAPGAMVGSLVGASGPEALTAILMHPRASELLERAIHLGQGQIPIGRWSIITQAAMQASRSEANKRLEDERRSAAQ